VIGARTLVANGGACEAASTSAIGCRWT
jgi:hypothetical protein